MNPARIPRDVEKRLASLERTNGELLERLAALEEHFLRVQVENHSIRNWMAQRLVAISERVMVTGAQAESTMSACEDPEKRRKWIEHIQAMSYYMGVPCPPPPPISPPPSNDPPAVAGPSSFVPDGIPADFFEGMKLVSQDPPVSTAMQRLTAPPTALPQPSAVDIALESTPRLILHAPGPTTSTTGRPPVTPRPTAATSRSEAIATGIDGQLGKEAEIPAESPDDELLPPPSSWLRGSPSVSNTPRAHQLADRSKRTMSTLDELDEDDNNPAKKQKLM